MERRKSLHFLILGFQSEEVKIKGLKEDAMSYPLNMLSNKSYIIVSPIFWDFNSFVFGC